MIDTLTYGRVSPIIEGDPISYSFNTPGWHLLLGILLATGMVMTLIQVLKYRRNAYRRLGIKQLQEILQSAPGNAAFEINLILKKIAIGKFGRERVANLSGADWFSFLSSTSTKMAEPGKHDQVFFISALYGNHILNSQELKLLAEFADQWIKTHDAG